jgi:hypothetical protein
MAVVTPTEPARLSKSTQMGAILPEVPVFRAEMEESPQDPLICLTRHIRV